jgi:hypothetical protein
LLSALAIWRRQGIAPGGIGVRHCRTPLHSARTQSETGNALKEAAQHYKVNTDAIAQKVKAAFAAKEKAQAAKKTAAKS